MVYYEILDRRNRIIVTPRTWMTLTAGIGGMVHANRDNQNDEHYVRPRF